MAAASQGSERAPGFSSPQEETLLELVRSADCLHRALQHRLKPSGLTLTQFNVLRILRGGPSGGLTCSAIGRAMITPEPDITRLLGRLKTQKLICQRRDSQDRRVVWTTITALGLEVLSGLNGIVEQAPRELFRELGCAELKELTRLLRKTRCCGADASASAAQFPPSEPRSPRSTLLPHRPE